MINQVEKLENQLNMAQIIKINKKSGTIQLGNKVTLKINDKEVTYQVLGSSEADPSKNIISHNSPIGANLIGKKVGDVITIKIKRGEVRYEVVSIS